MQEINIQDLLSKVRPYASYVECISAISYFLGAEGLDEDDLVPYQRDALRDLFEGLDEAAIAHLYNYWDYDLPKLSDIGRGWQKDVPAKPRIDLHVEVTSHSNLKIEWFPRDCGIHGCYDDPENVDFKKFRTSRGGGYHERPLNELLFIHNLSGSFFSLGPLKEYDRPLRRIDPMIVLAAKKLTSVIKERLEHHFDVRMCTDMFLNFEEDRMEMRRDYRLTGWSIEDPADVLAKKEREEIQDIELRLELTASEFVEVWKNASSKKGSGPTPSPTNVSAKVAKQLRERGHEVTKTVVDRYQDLLARHSAHFDSEQDAQP